MLIADVYHPDQWHDFFLMVGGAAAALTGLVFVALSLNVGRLLPDPTHRYRSIGTLTNFAVIFVVCALALMGSQHHVAIAVEWLLVSFTGAAVYVNGYLRARRGGGSQRTLTVVRTLSGTAMYLAVVVGSILLASGSEAGLYVAAAGLVLLGVYSVSGAWLLILSAYDDDQTRADR
jgi:modulator of FtsH protease